MPDHQQPDSSARHAGGDKSAVVKLDCAWCLAERGIAPGEGSHGICSSHAQQLLRAYRERRQQRAQHFH